MAVELNFLSLNVGMSATLAGLTSLITVHRLDIIFLQEVRLGGEQLNFFVGSLGFQAEVNIDTDQPTRPGTALVWKKSLPVSDVFTLVVCRAQVALLGPYMLLNIYAPSGSDKKYERAKFIGQDIFRVLSLHSGASWILGGDWNCVLKTLDIEGGTGFSQKVCPALRDLVRSYNLCDVFRHEFPRKEEFTFFRAGKAPSRLDRFYLSRSLVEGLSGTQHVASLSDHCGVQMSLWLNVELVSLPQNLRRTYWKLNTSILNDEEFLPSFIALWSEISKAKIQFVDCAEWWDKWAKPEIKDFCIGFSIHRKRRRNDTKKYLLSYLKAALGRKDWDEVARVREDLDIMMLADAMGVVVRSRFKQNVEFEKASLFHAAKEAKNDKNNLGKLKIGGVIVTDKKKIEEEVVKFFTALFNGHHDVNLVDTGVPFVPDHACLDEFLVGLGRLSDLDSSKLHEDISMHEMTSIVENCENNKSPGLDGLSYEFYKAVWQVIAADFVQVLQCQLDRQRLIDSDKVGATRLTSKVVGVPQVDELRPITLLNCDYKLLTKLFVLRMIPIMTFIIRSGQLCSVGSKNILFGVSNVMSSLLYIKEKKLAACMISLDFFKAYDRVMVEFLILVMQKMNFGVKFCEWIRMLHQGAQTKCILQWLTDAINVSFSIRQGDPLAMLLYIIYIEPLLLYLERVIVGLRMAGIPKSIEAYCDDVNILTDRLSDFLVVDLAVRKFEVVSGAILSRTMKSKVIGFGSWKNKTDWPLEYLKTVKEIKVFGIFVMDSFRGLIKKNWDYRFEKFQDVIRSWTPRVLETLVQRVDVLRLFALSRVVYVASILPIRGYMIKKFEKEMGKFIWNASGKVLKVSLDELRNPPDRGGLGVPCILSLSKSLLLSQLLRLLRSGDVKSVQHASYWLGELLEDLGLGLDVSEHATYLPEYYDGFADLLVEAIAAGWLSRNGWSTLSNKIIYAEHSKNFPMVKVEREALVDYKNVWKRLASPVLTAVARDTLFLLLHNKLPVRERLFRIGLAVDPYCEVCPGGVVCDLEHFFCSCSRVVLVWSWVRRRLLDMLGVSSQISNWELINLYLPSTSFEKEIVWLVGTYVAGVWSEIFIRNGAFLKGDQFFGFLKFKYKAAQLGSRMPLSAIPGIAV